MLFSHWPIRNKLQLGLGLLAVSVLTLFGSAYYGLYAYRGLVKSLSARSAELPLADKLRDHVADLHEILSQVHDRQSLDDGFGAARTTHGPKSLGRRRLVAAKLSQRSSTLFCQTLDNYREQLDTNRLRTDAAHRRRPLRARNTGQDRRRPRPHQAVRRATTAPTGCLDNKEVVSQLRDDVDTLRELAAELPSHLHDRFRELASDVRSAVPLGDQPGLGDDRAHDAPAGRGRATVPQMDRPAAGDARPRLARSGRRQVRPPHPPR